MTNHWIGYCVMLDAIDFERRDSIPHCGRPFDRDHLLPYYHRAQTICQRDEFD